MNRKKLIRFFKNKFVITSLVFIVWIVFFDQASIPRIIRQRTNNNKVRKEIKLIDQKTIETENQIKVFKTNKDSIEKYARENYYMKRDNEDIYIFD